MGNVFSECFEGGGSTSGINVRQKVIRAAEDEALLTDQERAKWEIQEEALGPATALQHPVSLKHKQKGEKQQEGDSEMDENVSSSSSSSSESSSSRAHSALNDGHPASPWDVISDMSDEYYFDSSTESSPWTKKGDNTEDDFRAFLFLIHPMHGLLLLHCTRKKNKPPHYQLPGGHVDAEEFAMHERNLFLAARAGVAREVWEETGIDLRYIPALDGLLPLILRPTKSLKNRRKKNSPKNRHSKKNSSQNNEDEDRLPNEFKQRLFFVASVTDDDFHKLTDPNRKKVTRCKNYDIDPPLFLELSVEHSGFRFEKDPMKALDLLQMHSGGKVSRALAMALDTAALKSEQDSTVPRVTSTATTTTAANKRRPSSSPKKCSSPPRSPKKKSSPSTSRVSTKTVEKTQHVSSSPTSTTTTIASSSTSTAPPRIKVHGQNMEQQQKYKLQLSPSSATKQRPLGESPVSSRLEIRDLLSSLGEAKEQAVFHADENEKNSVLEVAAPAPAPSNMEIPQKELLLPPPPPPPPPPTPTASTRPANLEKRPLDESPFPSPLEITSLVVGQQKQERYSMSEKKVQEIVPPATTASTTDGKDPDADPSRSTIASLADIPPDTTIVSSEHHNIHVPDADHGEERALNVSTMSGLSDILDVNGISEEESGEELSEDDTAIQAMLDEDFGPLEPPTEKDSNAPFVVWSSEPPTKEKISIPDGWAEQDALLRDSVSNACQIVEGYTLQKESHDPSIMATTSSLKAVGNAPDIADELADHPPQKKSLTATYSDMAKKKRNQEDLNKQEDMDSLTIDQHSNETHPLLSIKRLEEERKKICLQEQQKAINETGVEDYHTRKMSEPLPSSSNDAGSTVVNGKSLVVLISTTSSGAPKSHQDRALFMLKGYQIHPELVDGADPAQKDLRNKLFEISGVRGHYPQFFLKNTNTNGDYSFIGNFDDIESLNDQGPLDELLFNK